MRDVINEWPHITSYALPFTDLRLRPQSPPDLLDTMAVV